MKWDHKWDFSEDLTIGKIYINKYSSHSNCVIAEYFPEKSGGYLPAVWNEYVFLVIKCGTDWADL